MPLPKDSVLPAGALVAVTGANGFVGSFVADELLQLGFRVRGTVRDTVKSAWLKEHFDQTYGPGKFELVELKDFAAPGGLDGALQDADALAHIASDLSFGDDPEIVIKNTVGLMESVMEAANKQPSIKRIVYTSSASAVNQLKINEKYDLTADSWNEGSVKIAYDASFKEPTKGLHVYNASKVLSEQALWKFVKEQKPHFVANTVLPDFVTGAPMSPGQGWPSSTMISKSLWEGKTDFFWLYPQYMVDIHDTAKLHVAALTKPDAENERIYAYGHQKRWTDWIAMLKDMYPDVGFPNPPENEGHDLAVVTTRPRSEELLKWLSGKGFTPQKDSLKELGDYIAKHT